MFCSKYFRWTLHTTCSVMQVNLFRHLFSIILKSIFHGQLFLGQSFIILPHSLVVMTTKVSTDFNTLYLSIARYGLIWSSNLYSAWTSSTNKNISDLDFYFGAILFYLWQIFKANANVFLNEHTYVCTKVFLSYITLTLLTEVHTSLLSNMQSYCLSWLVINFIVLSVHAELNIQVP